MTDASETPLCRGVQRAIQEALGVTGLPAETVRHLETCLVCGREAESIARLVGGFRSLPMAEPSQVFLEDLLRKVFAEIHAVQRRYSWSLSALTAAALVLIMIIPAERERWSARLAGQWLADVAVTDPWLDPLDGVRSVEQAARVVRQVALAQGFGPRAIQRMVDVTEEEAVRRPETLAWNLLDTLGPQDLERVLARLEKGVAQ